MMINHLSMLLDNFPGTSNQTWCFLHILSITAKAIIKQFDILKAKIGVVLDQAAQALASLAEGLDVEEQDTYGAQECRDDEANDPPLDWWTDFQDSLTEQQRDELELSIQPVQATLTKVSCACHILFTQLLTLNNWEKTRNKATQICICHEKLNHNSPPSVVQNTSFLHSPPSYDAP